MIYKKLFSHTAIYGIGPQIPKLASLFALPIITKHLTDVDFGVYGLITAVVGSISVLSYLGLNIVLSNIFYKSAMQYKWGWRQIYGFLTLWNLPYAILLGLIIFFFIPTEAKQHTWLIVLLNTIPVVFFGPTAMVATLYYQLKQQPFKIAIRSVAIGLLTVALNIYFIAYKEFGYLGWFLASAIAQMLNQISYWIPLNRQLGLTPIYNFKWRYIRNQLRISLPTVPHYYGAYLLNTSDRVVMKFLNISTSNIGLYNAANTIGNFVQLAGNASGQAIGPLLLQAYRNKQEEVARNLIFTLQLAFLVSTFTVSLWLKEVFFILIKNTSLSHVYPLGIIIIMAYNYRPMYFGANTKLFYAEKTRVLIKVTFIAGIANVALNLTLMPFFGYSVAAYTTFAGLMYMGYAGYYLKEFKESCKLNYYPLYWLLGTILMTIFASIAVEFSFLIKGLITFSIASLSLIYIKKKLMA